MKTKTKLHRYKKEVEVDRVPGEELLERSLRTLPAASAGRLHLLVLPREKTKWRLVFLAYVRYLDDDGLDVVGGVGADPIDPRIDRVIVGEIDELVPVDVYLEVGRISSAEMR